MLPMMQLTRNGNRSQAEQAEALKGLDVSDTIASGFQLEAVQSSV